MLASAPALFLGFLMADIPIFSVVAFSGTGKTTLLERLVAELKSRGERVAVVKHDAHEFDIDHEGKDSWRFTQAGADVTVVVSGSKSAMMENRPVALETLIGRITDVDINLTEGYKSGGWPKIAVHRSAAGKPLPVPPAECFAIMTDVSVQTDTPCFGLDDICKLADLIINDIDNK